jgi:site-specific recombinase XerD
MSTLKGQRNRASLTVLLYRSLRREAAAQLLVNNLMEHRGIKHLKIRGKGDKIRYLRMHPIAMTAWLPIWERRTSPGQP